MSTPARPRRSAWHWVAAVGAALTLGGAAASPPSNPLSVPPGSASQPLALPHAAAITGAALVWFTDGGHADVDIFLSTVRDPGPLRAAIERLRVGTGWTLSRVQVQVKSTERMRFTRLAPMKQTAASFSITGPLLRDGGDLPIAIFAEALADLAPFSCSFAVPPGLYVTAPAAWTGDRVGARLRPGSEEGMYDYYIAAATDLAAPDPKPAAVQPVSPGSARPPAGSVWMWVVLGGIVVAAAGMVRLYVARRSRRLTGGRDGSRSTLPTRRRETGV